MVLIMWGRYRADDITAIVIEIGLGHVMYCGYVRGFLCRGKCVGI